MGCGAYKNPVDDILDIWESAIKKYGMYFKCIYFPVLSRGENNNFQNFKLLESLSTK